ncbi:hypothetical protein LNP00_03560 [Fructobacillus sp. M158]|uniref:hypothetical protein n=1 Tax=Fructobacillus parabroussonetiae TaxID=2713174 RepID=UPI00200B20E1|nr:hypothetical protein [Fructobacillus parabroussonetiae]MCK8617444.1 hypothetical protein [Fructobacillus parabroussonetiae]
MLKDIGMSTLENIIWALVVGLVVLMLYVFTGEENPIHWLKNLFFPKKGWRNFYTIWNEEDRGKKNRDVYQIYYRPKSKKSKALIFLDCEGKINENDHNSKPRKERFLALKKNDLLFANVDERRIDVLQLISDEVDANTKYVKVLKKFSWEDKDNNWDKDQCKKIYGLIKSRNTLSELGIDNNTIKKLID